MTVSSREVLAEIGYWLPIMNESRESSGAIGNTDVLRTLFVVTGMGDHDKPMPVSAETFEKDPTRAFWVRNPPMAFTLSELEKWPSAAEAMLAAILGTAFGGPHYSAGPYCEVECAPTMIHRAPSNFASFESSPHFIVRWHLGLVEKRTISDHLEAMKLGGRRIVLQELAKAALTEHARSGYAQTRTRDPSEELDRLGAALRGIRCP